MVGAFAMLSSSALPLTMAPSRRDYEMGQFDWTPDEYLERIRSQMPRYDELQEQADRRDPLFARARA